MIAAPRSSVPIPDAVASFSARRWTDAQRADVTTAGDACRRYTSRELAGGQYVEARWLIAQQIAAVNKRLATREPRRVRNWNNIHDERSAD